MDRVTDQLIKEFSKDNALKYDEKTASVVFEKFTIYSTVMNEFNDSFDIDDVHIGGGEDEGIDGICIIINDEIVTSESLNNDIFTATGSLNVKFIFVQSETSGSFSVQKLTHYVQGVKKFLESSLSRDDFESDDVYAIYTVIDKIYSNVKSLKKNPEISIYYVTTSSNVNDKKINDRKARLLRELISTNLLSNVNINLIGATEIQNLYRRTRETIVKELVLSRKATLPPIPDVAEAYVGILPVKEYIELITDDNGLIDKSLFYDNVRDYQGDNDVNKEMSATLKSTDQSLRFVLLNNGITIVAKRIQSTGDKIVLRDFQIVNGCQTSHVIYNNRASIGDDTSVTLKIIATESEDVTNDVIRSTNRQTQVKEEELMALSDFQKRIEDYYNSYSNEPEQRLFYERRSKQYISSPGVEKIRIVTVPVQIKTFASAFLRRPHSSTAFYGELKGLVGSRIFMPNHKPILYYLSALINFRLDYLFRSKTIDTKYRRYRHFILMSYFYVATGKYFTEDKFNSRAIETESEKVVKILTKQEDYLPVFEICLSHIDAIADFDNREQVKLASLTESLERHLGIKPKIN